MFFRDNAAYQVLGFTATQIPNISNRRYPAELAGKLYPEGIPIFDENDLESLIDEYSIDEVYFSYSDVSHEYVMHLASRVQAKGASFVLLGPRETMLKSSKKIIAVTAARTGAGKSALSLALGTLLKERDARFVVIRHPMPYGDLIKQRVQRFASMEDLERNKCTIEEREEYEPHIKNGSGVYAGIDYGAILKEAEKEADFIIWDGGNNDMSFIKPDLHFTVTDALRPGHEMWYYPGETNFRSADVIVINKISENPMDAKRIMKNAEKSQSQGATVSRRTWSSRLRGTSTSYGKKAIVVEDGPTVNARWHELRRRIRVRGAQRCGHDRPEAVRSGKHQGMLLQVRAAGQVILSMGYYGKQIEELTETINRSKADIVVSGTPVDITRMLKVKIPVLHMMYAITEMNWSPREDNRQTPEN